MSRLSTTRGQIVLLAVGIVAVALVIADVAVYATVVVTQSQASDSVLVSQAQTIASGIQDNNGTITIDGNDIPAETQGGVAVDAAVIAGGSVVAKSPNQGLPDATLTSLARRAIAAAGPVWWDVVDSRNVPRRAYAQPITTAGNALDALVVSRSVKEMLDSQRQTLIILVAASLALLVIGGVLAYWLAGRALRPVRTIAGLARSISEHDLNRRVDLRAPPDELGDLVDTFNSMLARLEAGFTSMSTFTANASHELRAPLALMRSELDGALGQTRSREEYRRVLESLQAEVEHLSRLSDQLLILARADAGALVPAKEPIDVADFLHETAARWEDVADRSGTRVEVGAPSSGEMSADPALLRRVVDNLIENAVRHTAPGTDVVLRGYQADGGWNVDVADHGPGVTPGHRDRLFVRFARADSARSPEDGGAGLGLALSAAIAQAHGGNLELVDSGGSGAVFRLHVPNDASTPRSSPAL